MSNPRVTYGGSFAPPLSEDLLARYRSMAAELPADSRVRDVMQKLLYCCDVWWELPESNGTATKAHPSGTGTIVALADEHQTALWDHIPWDDELDGMAAVLDGIDPSSTKPLRDAAHHLLWHVRELALDREPLTADKL